MKRFLLILAVMLWPILSKSATYQNNFTTNANPVVPYASLTNAPQVLQLSNSATVTFSIVSTQIVGSVTTLVVQANSGSSANGLTNQTFLFPQVLVISNGVLGVSTNTFDLSNLYWTNAIPPNKLFYSEANGVWAYGTVLDPNDPSMDANPIYYIGFNSPPTNDAANWQNSNTVSLTVSCVVQSYVTNSIYSLSSTGLVYQIPSGSFIYAKDAFGRTLFEQVDNSSYSVSFSPTYYWSEVGSAYTYAGANNVGGAGVQSYFYNSASRGVIPYADKRFGVGVTTLFGTNGMYGAQSEFLVLRRSNYVSVASPAWQYVAPIKIDGDGGVSVGNNSYAEHTHDYKANAVLKVRASLDTNKPSFMIDGGYAYTGTPTNGAFWHTNNRIFLTQGGTTFTIPQLNNTNIALTAATTFTWSFTYPFANTNYSVGLAGMGNPLVSPQVGTKTTTNVVITFTAFTGTLNATAMSQ